MARQSGHAIFNLTRYFSILSLLLIGLAGLVLGSYFHQFATHHMISQAEHDNVAMTHFVRHTHEQAFVQLALQRNDAEATALLSQVLALIEGSDVIKVKLYDAEGTTVFSTDPDNLGELYTDKPGFQQAMRGRYYSGLKHRDRFKTHDNRHIEVNFIATYVPMRAANGDVFGVFEIYREVSPLVARVNETLWQVATTAAIALLTLYLLQLLVVRHAQRILRLQAGEMQDINQELDRRVQERTQELRNEVNERLQAERKLDHLAYHDPLTDLPNRLMFKDYLSKGLARIERDGGRLALLFIDLDRFKDVNDTLGHTTGDKLLLGVTQRIKRCVRDGDILARHGGDEFICIMEGIDSPHQASQIADKLLASFDKAFSLEGHKLHLSASVGICLAPDNGNSVDILISNADTAMYQAKASGRNRYAFYTPQMTHHTQQRIQLENLLRQALNAQEMQIHFQPKLCTQSSALVGAEVLLRWHQGELGSIPPDRFIPVAEDTGQIIELGLWVLDQACRQLKQWDQRGFQLPSLAINLSVRQLDEGDFTEKAQIIISHHGIDPRRIEFEITESVIMSMDDSIATLNALRELGCSLSVDDFGTGYSSLSYLKKLPVQYLKIDRSFIMGIGNSPSDEAIIRSVIALARSLGFASVAEGVETLEQVDFLLESECTQLQGYLLGRPEPAEVFYQDWHQRKQLRPQGQTSMEWANIIA